MDENLISIKNCITEIKKQIYEKKVCVFIIFIISLVVMLLSHIQDGQLYFLSYAIPMYVVSCLSVVALPVLSFWCAGKEGKRKSNIVQICVENICIFVSVAFFRDYCFSSEVFLIVGVCTITSYDFYLFMMERKTEMLLETFYYISILIAVYIFKGKIGTAQMVSLLGVGIGFMMASLISILITIIGWNIIRKKR